MNFITLNNGLKMPQLGFGVWQVPDEEATAAVSNAFKVGYTSIDTAMVYRNEVGVGKAIKESSIPREELFITDFPNEKAHVGHRSSLDMG